MFMILFRIPNREKRIVAPLLKENDDLETFPTRAEAIAMADALPTVQAGWPYQVVEIKI